MGTHPDIDKGRLLFGRLPSGPRCKLCSAPFGAPVGILLRRYGFAPWEKNPNICTRCLVGLERHDVSGAEVEISFLFADVRRSSDLARDLGTWEFTRLMQRFYSAANEVFMRNNALLDKFVGDEVVGFFLPFMTGSGHARQAINTAEELMHATGHDGSDEPWIPLGAGVHTGTAFVGLVSRGQSSDFTAFGDAVNIAAHLAAQAGPGEILVSHDAAAASELKTGDREQRHLSLKGHPVDAIVLPARYMATD